MEEQQLRHAREEASSLAISAARACKLRVDSWKITANACMPVDGITDPDLGPILMVGPMDRSADEFWECVLEPEGVVELAATAPKPVAAGHVGTVRPEICVFRAVNPGVATVMFQQRQVANGGIMKLHRFEVRVRLVEDLFRIGCTGPGTRCGIM
eukprot:TRINITY_DN10483_c0_g1_i1.p3 TRINITY_DN10483_c0_g1~~TRINITY_DN10483_c0_g1_i1.p3  ORF type:complete len:155 (+),score=32.49 TRINITY_DN10483_c0_g1_i1:213-677(+)